MPLKKETKPKNIFHFSRFFFLCKYFEFSVREEQRKSKTITDMISVGYTVRGCTCSLTLINVKIDSVTQVQKLYEANCVSHIR